MEKTAVVHCALCPGPLTPALPVGAVSLQIFFASRTTLQTAEMPSAAAKVSFASHKAETIHGDTAQVKK
jgi:hypothetical protein